MRVKVERRRSPDVARPVHGQRKGDRRAARALADAQLPGWWARALPLWTTAAVVGVAIGWALLHRF